jgi:hypothetical protein
MDTKEQLIKSIKDWIKIDNDIRVLHAELTKKKKEKTDISKLLMETMKANEIDCFNVNDGQITYAQKNTKKAITKKHLFQLLSNYFKGDEEKATDINKFIMENREEVIRETIIRKIAKPSN